MAMLNRIHRRTFLERSLLGAGGVLFSSSLLQSCTDHNIPDPIDPTDPNTPVIIPPLGDAADNLNNDLRNAVTSGLQLIPDVGGLVGSLVSIFWPTAGDSPWDQIQNKVKALIDAKEQSLVFDNITADLISLKSYLSDYHKLLNAVNWDTVTWPMPKDPENATNKALGAVYTQWNEVDAAFKAALSHFQLQGYEAVLLPLFAPFANLYLAFYRDPLTLARNSYDQPIRDPQNNVVLNGTVWGMTDTEIDTLARTKLTQAASSTDASIGFAPYVTKWYNSHLASLQSVKVDTINNEPFKTTNAYTREMTISALDFMDTWQYYDITQYPNGAYTPDGTSIRLFTREIYSDPFGNAYVAYGDTRFIKLPSQATQLPTNITVWGGSRIDAVQLTYPWAGGPNGLNQTPRMGDQKGGTNQPPHGGELSLDPVNNPVIKAACTWDWVEERDKRQFVETLYFVYNNGVHSNTFGQTVGQYASGEIGYDGYALSSIYVQGAVFGTDNSANCMVFGFLRWSSPSDSLRSVARTYITSPREYSAAELGKAFPKFNLSANSISDGLKAARKAYWEDLKARAKSKR